MECEQFTELQFQVRKLKKELKEQNDRALTAVMELQAELEKAKGPCSCGQIINHDYCQKCLKNWAS